MATPGSHLDKYHPQSNACPTPGQPPVRRAHPGGVSLGCPESSWQETGKPLTDAHTSFTSGVIRLGDAVNTTSPASPVSLSRLSTPTHVQSAGETPPGTTLECRQTATSHLTWLRSPQGDSARPPLPPARPPTRPPCQSPARPGHGDTRVLTTDRGSGALCSIPGSVAETTGPWRPPCPTPVCGWGLGCSARTRA